MGPQVFNGCSSLEGYFYFPAGITTLENNMFNSTKIEGFCGPGVTTIKNDAFQSCKSLKSVELNSVETIEKQAFQKCSALQSVRFGPNVTTFGERAFHEDSSISAVMFEGDPPPSGKYFDQGGNHFIDFPKNGAVFYIPFNSAKNGPTEAWTAYADSWAALKDGNAMTFPALADGQWTDGSIINNIVSPSKTFVLRFWDPSDTSATAALLAY